MQSQGNLILVHDLVEVNDDEVHLVAITIQAFRDHILCTLVNGITTAFGIGRSQVAGKEERRYVDLPCS